MLIIISFMVIFFGLGMMKGYEVGVTNGEDRIILQMILKCTTGFYLPSLDGQVLYCGTVKKL